ncbi:uncharacterized protein A1O9_01974 [Exophiala aquamarina CBS 119918]|uniref:Uncharacterized protein n=1 Tax=Exophiala aquamarina CBS 119918 TaxID=1182545 RepID=A0A072PM51_9EURO|nr:uncharacterized protein A1O9_01974 [Exophiala aquamarina CBS 119918]KEF60413.1 hypothetical protein A1O9_01974 [Exophiala aquamarina CBS 119918]
MQSLQSSRIPHIALALISKRSSTRRCLNHTFQASEIRNHVYARSSMHHFDRHASTALKRMPRQKPVRRDPVDTTAPLPKPVYQPYTRPLPQFLQRLFVSKAAYFWGASIMGVAFGIYCTMTYISYRRAVERAKSLDLPQNADVSSRWLDLSRDFDDEVDLSERLARLHKKRAALCTQAHGNVLEVSCGTGRNMRFYDLRPLRQPSDTRVKSLVFNDQSEIMVYQAQKKYDKLQEAVEPINKFKGPVRFIVGDGGDRRVIRRPEGGFDVIIQTMGICSMANPVEFLKRLGTLARQPGEKSATAASTATGKQAEEAAEGPKATDYGSPDEEAEASKVSIDRGGKILLLEHGRSTVGFVNNFLDDVAKEHADRYGCWWNKDIEKVVNASGLVVESMNRSAFGTVYEYVLRPAPAVELKERGEKKA